MELKADRNIFAEIFIAFLFTEISHISGSFIGNGTVMVLCPLSLSCTLSFLTEAFLWTGREPSVWNEHMGLICSSLSDWWPGGSPIFSSPENRALKNNLLISLLKKMLPSSTFSEFPDPPTLFPLLTLLWQLVVLIVSNMKWKVYYIFELFLRLLGHLSIFSSFLGSSLISLPWINWKFLEEMEMLLGVIFDWILCVIEVRECCVWGNITSFWHCYNIVDQSRWWNFSCRLFWLETGGFWFLTSFGAGVFNYCFCWLIAPKHSLDFGIYDNHLATVSSNFRSNKIFEFNLSIRVWDFSLIILSSFLSCFTNAIKVFNLQTHVQVFTDCY